MITEKQRKAAKINIRKAQSAWKSISGRQHAKGDMFEAKPRPNVPEREKPTPAQRKAQLVNIKKAQAAKRARKG